MAAALVLGGAVVVPRLSNDASVTNNTAAVAAADSDAAAATRSTTPCADAAKLAAPEADRAALTEVVAAYLTSQDGDCAPLTMADSASGDGFAWSASGTDFEAGKAVSTTWLAVDDVVLTGDKASLATLKWSKPLDIKTLVDTLVPGWKQPQPGQTPPVTIVADDPQSSPVALAGIYGLATLANGGTVPTTVNYGSPKITDLASIRLEHAVMGPAEAKSSPKRPTVRFSTASAAGDAPTVAIGATAVPQVGLVLTGDAPPVAGLRTWLSGITGRQALTDAGFTPAVSERSHPLTPAAAATFQKYWAGVSARTSTLAVLDTSGSMNYPMPGGPTPKIDLVRLVAAQAYALAAPNARSGVMTFSTGAGSSPQITTLAKLATNSSADAGTNHALASIAKINTMTAHGGTPLYEAIGTAYRAAVKGYTPGATNQVMVLTDGANEESTSTVTLTRLLADLKKAQDKRTPVRIVIVALKPDDSYGELKRIAEATGGEAFQATKVADIPGAVQRALFS